MWCIRLDVAAFILDSSTPVTKGVTVILMSAKGELLSKPMLSFDEVLANSVVCAAVSSGLGLSKSCKIHNSSQRLSKVSSRNCIGIVSE